MAYGLWQKVLSTGILLALLGSGSAWAATNYTVRAGDTLFTIGQRFGVSWTAIQQANNLKSTAIYPGQVLQIPAGNTRVHTVKAGESLYTIGRQYGVTPSQIQQANGLVTTVIQPGQKLVIPGGGVNNGATTGGWTYTIKAGDTLSLLQQRFGIPYREIMRANGLTSTSLKVGQRLVIPERRVAPSNDRSASAERVQANTATAPTVSNISASDLDMLARIVHGEARGEIYKGQVAVAAVVLNRVKHPNFPNSIAGVIYQPGAFTAVTDGQFYLKADSVSRQAAIDALKGWDPTGGALYYWNPKVATNKWIWSRPVTVTIGNHVFAH